MAFDNKTAQIAGINSSRSGVPNKINSEIRETFQMLIKGNLPKIEDWLKQVAEENPEKALMIIAKYAEFVLPKLSRSEVLMFEPEVIPDLSKLSDSALEEMEALYH